jgi:hypothetical protein
MDDVSNVAGEERSRLLIGAQNDPTNPVNSDALILQPFGGYLGIGQMNPAYALDVTGTINASSNINAQGGTIAIVGNSTLLDLWNYCSLTQNSSNVVVEGRNTLTLRSFASNVVFATSNFSWSFSNTSNTSNVFVVSSNGNLSNSNASSNTIGGVTLNNTTITNSGQTTSGLFTTAGAITTGDATSNRVGNVTLSNGSVTALTGLYMSNATSNKALFRSFPAGITGEYATTQLNGYFGVFLATTTAAQMDAGSNQVFSVPADLNGNAWYSNGPTGKFGINCNAPTLPLDITGQTRIYEATGTPTVSTTANTLVSVLGARTTGSLTLRHGTGPGQSSIVFPSAVNYPGDYGYITYIDDVSNEVGKERSRLLIGTDNDITDATYLDATVLQPFGGYVGVGQLNPAYQLDVTGTIRATAGLVLGVQTV